MLLMGTDTGRGWMNRGACPHATQRKDRAVCSLPLLVHVQKHSKLAHIWQQSLCRDGTASCSFMRLALNHVRSFSHCGICPSSMSSLKSFVSTLKLSLAPAYRAAVVLSCLCRPCCLMQVPGASSVGAGFFDPSNSSKLTGLAHQGTGPAARHASWRVFCGSWWNALGHYRCCMPWPQVCRPLNTAAVATLQAPLPEETRHILIPTPTTVPAQPYRVGGGGLGTRDTTEHPTSMQPTAVLKVYDPTLSHIMLIRRHGANRHVNTASCTIARGIICSTYNSHAEHLYTAEEHASPVPDQVS